MGGAESIRSFRPHSGLEFGIGDVGVYLSVAYVRMAERALDEPYVLGAPVQLRCKGVPEEVGVHVQLDPGTLSVLLDAGAHVSATEWAAVFGREHERVRRSLAPIVEEVQDAYIGPHNAIFPALALADTHLSGLEVDIVPTERERFRATQAGGEH